MKQPANPWLGRGVLIALVLFGLSAWQVSAIWRVNLPLIAVTPANTKTPVPKSATLQPTLVPRPSVTPVATLRAGVSVSLEINGDKRYQTIDGFGVNINGMAWENGKVKTALDQFSGTMRATIYRVIIDEADWEAQNDNADPRSFNWNYYNTIYQQPKFQSLWQTLRYLEQQGDSQIILNVMGRVTPWMGRTWIDEGQEDEWVEMIASLVVYARQNQQLKIRLLSPFNEIDIGDPEGPSVQPEQAVRLLSKLVTRLRDLGYADTQLIIPDTAKTDFVPYYLDAILADVNLTSQVAKVAFHNYGGSIEAVESAIKGSAYPELRFWVTEYSQWCDQCNTGASGDNTWSVASGSANYLFHYLEHGASGALLWEGFDSTYNHHGHADYWGVLATTSQGYAPRLRFYTAAQVFRYVRPGMVRVGVSSASPDLQALAFVDTASGAVTIVGMNNSANSITINGTLANLGSPASLNLSWTTETQQLAYAGPALVSNGAFSATVPANSVFALSTLAP